MSPLLMEGDIRAPEVWWRVDIHDRRAAPIDVDRTPAEVLDSLLRGPSDAQAPFVWASYKRCAGPRHHDEERC